MKILHIASFKGNVGDNASHLGFYSLLDEIGCTYYVDKIEIRKLYKNYKKSDKLSFNVDLIEKINTYDLCVIGGGGFLDYWISDSKTGTTIDIDPILVDLIKTPTIFTSIGSNPHQEIPDGNILKFKNFLNALKNNKQIKIALRNDGSVESIKRDLGEEYLDGIVEILDHGFFYKQLLYFPKIIDNKYIAINITDDQILMKSNLRGNIVDFDYLGELRDIVNYCVNVKGLDVVFVPHIFSDVKAIYKLLEVLDNSIVRNNISVAPCLQGDYGAQYIFSIYENSEYVIGTRFHANVCSIAMGKNTIGLVALDRVEYLYRSLGRGIDAILLEIGFGKKVIEHLDKYPINNSCLQELKNKTLNFYKKFISNNILNI